MIQVLLGHAMLDYTGAVHRQGRQEEIGGKIDAAPLVICSHTASPRST